MKLSEFIQEYEKETPQRASFPLALKIVLPVVFAIALTCLFLFTVYSHRLEQQGNLLLRNQLESFATSKATELAEPVWNFQADFIHRLMHSYLDNDNLLEIILYDTNGQEISEVANQAPPHFSTIMVTERVLRRKAGEEVFTLGKLVVKFHDAQVQADLKSRQESDIIFTCVLMVILAGSIMLAVHLLVGRPLKRIRNSLEENRETGRRSPLLWNSSDELGEVVSAYNLMLEEVQQRTEALIGMNSTLRYEVENRILAERELGKAQEELEHKVAMRTLELNLANQELIDLDQQRSVFLSSASHELRTPLAAVLGFSTMVKKHFTKFFIPIAEQNELADKGAIILDNLGIIGREGARLTRLIDDLLDLNKIEAGHMEWRDEKLDVEEEIRRCIDTLASSAAKRPGVDLKTTIHQNIPALYCDPDRFQQLLMNIITNAIEHTETGVVRVEAQSENYLIRIIVTDTGAGIPEDQMPFIFHKFYQGPPKDDYKPSGTGLGLPICKNIVDHYGGDITVKSNVGKGTSFTIEIPSNLEIPEIY